MGMGRFHQVDVRIDGALVKRFTVGGEAPGRPAPASYEADLPGDPEWDEYILKADDSLEVRLPVQGDPRLVREMWEPEGVRST